MRNVLKRYLGDLLALLAIAAVVVLFFFRLFWPEPKLIVSPDFGRSDAWHFSFATKRTLAQALKENRLPLWEPRMGMGYPLFAEGQIGALFLPNLLLLKFVSAPLVAYNATYVVLFLILGWGMYCFLRVIGCSRVASLFGAFTISFSGQTIPRLPHHTLLESLSMTPLVLAIAHIVLTKSNPLWVSIFAFVLSQQLFTGSPQPVLLTLVVLGLYTVVLFWRAPVRQIWQPLSRLTIGYLLGAGMAAIQLLPSLEMLRESTSPGGFSPEEASYYSFPLVHLKTLIDPFILGNPKLGTYPPFTAFDGSIFWENNLFIGWLPLIVLFFVFRRPSRLRTFFLISLVTTFLFMLGKYSPLYLLYSIWPLNLFRVPSRFAWIFLITIVTSASWSLTGLLRQQRGRIAALVAIVLLILHAFQLLRTWWDYHAIVPGRLWITPTPFIEQIKKTQASVRTIGSELVHNKQFLKSGWSENLDRYRFLANTPAPNSNLYWDITQTDVYAGRFLKRPALVESLLGTEIQASEYVATISAQGKRLLDVYHSSVIVTAIPLHMKTSLPVTAATTSADVAITAYRNADATPRVYMATQTVIAPTLTKAAEALADPTFTPGKTVLVHDEALSMSEEGQEGSVEITNERPTRVTMHVDVMAEKAILVFGDTYYPGWQATIDGQSTKIFPVNIKERGIFLLKGSHEVIWQYQPKSLAIGTWTSAISTILTVLFLFLSKRDITFSSRLLVGIQKLLCLLFILTRVAVRHALIQGKTLIRH